MNRKAEGLTLQTIVVAVLVLVVLVVLIYIFANKIGGVRTELDSCAAKGGVCNTNSCNGPVISTKECEKCCVSLIEEKKS